MKPLVTPRQHPFHKRPHATLVGLTLPVLFSLAAEPLTGLVDTAFVSRLGIESLAALGVGTTVLSSVFWIFNFFSISTQTTVARYQGKQQLIRASQVSCLAIAGGFVCGLILAAAGLPLASPVASLMGAHDDVLSLAVVYMQIRLMAAPAILVTITAFGTLRGLQNMRTPLYVAVGVNLLNVVLDALLIFGWGPLPALGITGAAVASAVSQWVGAVWVVRAVWLRLPKPNRLQMGDFKKLLGVGRDLLIRTGLLTLFLLLCTRTATRIGADAGAAHQVIRQTWVLTALVLDAFAISGQSLIGYFMGSRLINTARRVASVVCMWSAAVGLMLCIFMVSGTEAMIAIMVPSSAAGVFTSAWTVAAVLQPINALSFATDGIHWGTEDYRYLRNGMLVATLSGISALVWMEYTASETLLAVWLITGGWVCIRAAFGMMRIWPGTLRSPLCRRQAQPSASTGSSGYRR